MIGSARSLLSSIEEGDKFVTAPLGHLSDSMTSLRQWNKRRTDGATRPTCRITASDGSASMLVVKAAETSALTNDSAAFTHTLASFLVHASTRCKAHAGRRGTCRGSSFHVQTSAIRDSCRSTRLHPSLNFSLDVVPTCYRHVIFSTPPTC